MGRLRPTSSPITETLPPEMIGEILGSLFPTQLEAPRVITNMEYGPDWEVTDAEVRLAIRRMKGGRKSPMGFRE